MLWTSLTAITSVIFFTNAVVGAKYAKAGFGGYALAIIIESALAIGNAWGMDKLLVILADLTCSYSETRQERLGRSTCLLVLLGGIFVALLTFWAPSAIMRLVV
jgi:hypothetical protein